MTVSTIELDNIEELQGVYDAIAAAHDATNYQGALGVVADDLRDVHQNYFLGSFGPSGEDWKPWYWRDPDVSNDHPTLIAHGRLRDSLVTLSPDHIEAIAPREMTWGTSVPYAGVHNFGAVVTVGGKGLVGRFGGFIPPGSKLTIPQREHVGMNDETTTNVVDKVADAAVEQLKG